MTTFRIFLLMLIAIPFVACQKPAVSVTSAASELNTTPTTIFLVRHSEKESGSNPALSTAGLERNATLQALLHEVEFDVVFTTPYRRTEMTADAVCDAQGLEYIHYDPQDLAGFAKSLQQEYRGKQILVVGHSNTTPTLCGLLDGTKAHAGFDESDYSNLMLVVIPVAGAAKTINLKF